LDETTYLDPNAKTIGNLRVSLSEGEYYVMGDNRTSSLDSRGFGPIRKDAIIGRVWLRGWPLNRATVIDIPIYE
jgi:signal peptidase I